MVANPQREKILGKSNLKIPDLGGGDRSWEKEILKLNHMIFLKVLIRKRLLAISNNKEISSLLFNFLLLS